MDSENQDTVFLDTDEALVDLRSIIHDGTSFNGNPYYLVHFTYPGTGGAHSNFTFRTKKDAGWAYGVTNYAPRYPEDFTRVVIRVKGPVITGIRYP